MTEEELKKAITDLPGAYLVMFDDGDVITHSYRGKGREIIEMIAGAMSDDDDLYRILKKALQCYELMKSIVE